MGEPFLQEELYFDISADLDTIQYFVKKGIDALKKDISNPPTTINDLPLIAFVHALKWYR